MNDARINEDPTTALIRDLRMEIDMLRSQYGSAKGQAAMAEISELKEKLASTQRLMEESQRSWEEKIARTKAMQEESFMAMEAQGVAKDLRKIDNRMPNLVNLNEDPQLSEMLIYILKEGKLFLHISFHSRDSSIRQYTCRARRRCGCAARRGACVSTACHDHVRRGRHHHASLCRGDCICQRSAVYP